jgi:transcriptional regulator with XRE-family HTH domain
MRSEPWQAAGALARELRIATGLSTCALARRSTVPCASISRFETGQIRPRRSLLSAVATGLDPDRTREIIGRLVDAAGGEDALAADGKWARYRWRRIERGILAGEVPLPSKLARSLELHRQGDEMWLRSMAILDGPGAWDDAEALDEAIRLHDESSRLRELAGPPIVLFIGKHVIRAGWRVP